MPSCGSGRRRDERAGTLARAAYWRGGRGIDARRLPRAREGHRRAPSAGCGGALTCGLLGARGHRLLARNPPERGHGSGAWPTRARACGCNSDAHTHRRIVRSPDAPGLLQVCTALGRSRQLRARRPLSAEAFGHGPSRARGNAVGCGRYRLQGQLRCKSTDEPVHSNIFPLRY